MGSVPGKDGEWHHTAVGVGMISKSGGGREGTGVRGVL